LKKKTDADYDKEYALLKERLGLDKDVSPDELRNALKGLVNEKKIADYKIKSEK
jgi:hypothetical protein